MKPVRLAVVLTFVALHLALKGLFFSVDFYVHVARPIEVATGGVVSPVVLSGLIQLVLLVAFVMVGLGGLRARDVGLWLGRDGQHLVNATLVALLLWGGVQAALSAFAATGRFDVSLNPALAHGPGWFSGRLLGAAFGGSFIEEVMYRGFLVPQCYLLVRRATASPAKAMAAALALPQLYFGLNHIPAALRMHQPAFETGFYLFHVLLVGFLFAALYLRTGNLFVVIVAHALVNFPAPVVVAGPDPSLFALVGVCILLLGWPLFHRWLGEVFTLEPPAPQPHAGALDVR